MSKKSGSVQLLVRQVPPISQTEDLSIRLLCHVPNVKHSARDHYLLLCWVRQSKQIMVTIVTFFIRPCFLEASTCHVHVPSKCLAD